MTEKFENESVEVTVDPKGGCEVTLTVFVKPAACEAARKKAVKEVRQHVSIPGFRKGKAPEAMIEKSYGKAVEEQFQESVQKEAMREMLALTNIYPWSGEGIPRPEVEGVSMEGSSMSFTFEREPEVPEIKGEELEVKGEKAKEITDKEIDEEIASLRKQRATQEEVEDGKVEVGGWCRIDLQSLKDDPPSNILTNHRLHLDPEQVAEWLIKMVKGKKAGESAEGKTEPTKDATEEELEKFEAIPVRATIVAVEKEVLPEDDALVEQLKVESMDDLKAKVRQKLEQDEKSRVERVVRENLWELLHQKFPFELPKSLIQAELQASLRRRVEELHQQGVTTEQIQEKEKELEAEAAKEVEGRLHVLFVSRKIVAEANHQPTDQELNQRAHEIQMWESLSQGRMVSPKEMTQQELSAYRNRAFLMMVQERAEEHLLGGAKVTD